MPLPATLIHPTTHPLMPQPHHSEPTSGLDARAAAIVMRSVKNVSLSNRTVMVTIHQASQARLS